MSATNRSGRSCRTTKTRATERCCETHPLAPPLDRIGRGRRDLWTDRSLDISTTTPVWQFPRRGRWHTDDGPIDLHDDPLSWGARPRTGCACGPISVASLTVTAEATIGAALTNGCSEDSSWHYQFHIPAPLATQSW